MLKLPTFIILFLSSVLCHAGLENLKDVIRDPIISRRCKSLLKDRSEKIRVQQRLNSMILRNQKLQGRLKPQQRVTQHKLKLNNTQLSNNLRLTSIRIKAMEENIIRKGCPGVTL